MKLFFLATRVTIRPSFFGHFLIVSAFFAGLLGESGKADPTPDSSAASPAAVEPPDVLKEPDVWVDVSESVGIPLGGLGSGYAVFGQYGFVDLNYDGKPDDVGYQMNVPGVNAYTKEPEKKSSFGFVLTERDQSYILQRTPAAWSPQSKPFDTVSSYAYLPKGVVKFDKAGLDLSVTVNAFTPLLPHDLASATIPVQIFDVTVENTSTQPTQANFRLVNSQSGDAKDGLVEFRDNKGQMAFALKDGHADANGIGADISLPAQGKQTLRFVVGYYYPMFKQARMARRYYTKAFPDAAAVAAKGLEQADAWLQRIDQWHDSIQVPSDMKRLWFASLTSVMTSTMLSDDPYFFEIETPHGFLNTMDVDVYSGWVYLINWPELEKMSMDMYFSAIPKDGPKKGFVWHSLWTDSADYVEEPTFLVRFYRDQLWYNDKDWTQKGFREAVDAANHVYKADHYRSLIESKGGRQSYDRWSMPGASAYINSAWIYGLYGLDKLSQSLGQPVDIDGQPIADFRTQVAQDFDSLLWNDSVGDWNCFYRTPSADKGSNPNTTFTDQLFGKWVLAIDPGAEEVLPAAKVSQALHTVYKNNLVEDTNPEFRGWVNGMLPDHKRDNSGFHAEVFWIGPQINIGSLLGLSGDEAASLDVFQSVEKSLHNYDLAVGEWNGFLDDQMHVVLAKDEPGKDTPRFPPYPRYKSCWEYMIRILGLQMDGDNFYLNPFKTIDFSLQSVQLAGTTFSINVQAGWNHVLVNHNPATLPIKISRLDKEAVVEFLK